MYNKQELIFKQKKMQIIDQENDINVPRNKSRVAPIRDPIRLPNGDTYSGTSRGPAPHGHGTYFWQDGCQYSGMWKNGKPSGTGTFSWPSGARYDGDFKSGKMEGYGCFVGCSGDFYNGEWVKDRKEGFGKKMYANGDWYEGDWKKGLMEGNGRYVWRNGNEYVGEWCGGQMCGRGVLVWNNGSRYDGDWENGVPKGQGVFTWPDDSCYIGSRNRELNSHQILDWTFFPENKPSLALTDEHSLIFDQKMAARLMMDDDCMIATSKKRSLVDGGRGSGTEKGFPRICIWESDGEAGDITCDVLDDVEASMFFRDASTGLGCDGFKHFMRNPFCFNGEVKKPGQTIAKGHKNYLLMLNLQLGIRYTVGKHGSISREIKQSDFDPNEKFWTRFPPEGSKNTPPHQSGEFRWKDYCPVVFRHLRELFQVDPADYMLAICGNDALREFCSPGKSGSFFYLTQDDRFIIKTVKKSESKVLIKMLPSYYQHVCRFESTLVTKFFGIHCVKPVGGLKTRFIVMGNLFCSEYRIHRRFDLKGSSHGRTTGKPEREIDETTTLKDLDLNFAFRLQGNLCQELIKQIDRDCGFLEAERIMDYSLLVGIHFRDVNTGDKLESSPTRQHSGNESFETEKFMHGGYQFLEAEDHSQSGRKPSIRLGSNMPARAEWLAQKGNQDTPDGFNPSSRSRETYEVILYFGIIDILQDYDISKKLERAYKSLHVDSTLISAVDPKLYSKRFREFMGKIFL